MPRPTHIVTLFGPTFSLLLALGACRPEDTSRVERIEKLRAIGISANPVVLIAPAPGTSGSIELTTYAALPLGASVSAQSFLDEGSTYNQPVPVVMTPGSEATQQMAALDIFSVKATVTVGPLTAEQQVILATTGKLALRYGIQLDSGEESERIVGNILVYPATAQEVTYQSVGVSVAEPLANATVSSGPDQVLSGTVTKPQSENIKVSWFVSSGKVTNRRAKETKWEPEKTGIQTVIMTARGMKSGSFALQAVDVTVE